MCFHRKTRAENDVEREQCKLPARVRDAEVASSNLVAPIS